VFPLQVQDRLSGLLLITSMTELQCTEETIGFIRLISEVTSTGLFGTSMFEYLDTSYLQIVLALANAVEAKDPYTRGHSERVAFYSIQIAMALGLTKQEKEHLSFAAILHDIGKIGTNIGILNKQEKLLAQEQNDMRTHALIGASILAPVHFLKPIISVVRHHHENFDGSGYPSELKGSDIPLKARIVKIADAWDAMTTDRPYRKALSREAALEQLKQYSGTQFDPELVNVFIQTSIVQDGLS
jgi:putative nucleotidyltransferase with HDIG domain